MKILVTGGAGFIGRNLVAKLKKQGHEVQVFDISTASSRNTFGKHDINAISHRYADWLDYGMEEPFDIIYHLAAFVSAPLSLKQPDFCYTDNVEGLLKVITHFKYKRFVFASSAAVYGNGKGYDLIPKSSFSEISLSENHVEHIDNLLTPYAKSKLIGESLVKDIVPSYCNLRFFNVYGNMQNPHYGAVIQKFGENWVEQKPYTIYGDGEQVRDFVYVDDVVDALIFSGMHSDNFTANVGTGQGTTVNELCKLFGGQLENVDYKEEREGDPSYSVADVSVLEDLGWKAEYDIKSGIKKLKSLLIHNRQFK